MFDAHMDGYISGAIYRVSHIEQRILCSFLLVSDVLMVTLFLPNIRAISLSLSMLIPGKYQLCH